MSKQTKQVNLSVDERLLQDIMRISKELGSAPEQVLASLVWLGKKAMGRRIKIESSQETKVLTITAFESHPKIEPLTDDQNG